jgi:hypothetical protein
VIRTLTRRVAPWLGPLATLVCSATSLYAQKASPKAAPPPESSGFIGEFILAFCAVGLVLYAVCAPSDKAT